MDNVRKEAAFFSGLLPLVTRPLARDSVTVSLSARAEGGEKTVAPVGLESPQEAVVVLHAESRARLRSVWPGRMARIGPFKVAKTLFYQISTGY